MTDTYVRRLIKAFEASPNKVAMRIVGVEDEVYTFSSSLAAIRSIAFRLGQEGIKKGDRVILIGNNHPCWALSYLGILYHGAVCVPLDPDGEIETITNFIENSEARLAFTSSDLTAKFSEAVKRIGRPIPYVAWKYSGGDAEIQRFEDWAETPIPDEYASQIPNISGDDNALLMYTSGTTGKPKGVPLTHGNIIAELIGIDEVLKLTSDERILSLLPLFHAYLQIVNLWVATTIGCEVGYLKELSPAELSNAMKEFKPTILTTVPRLWYLFHKKIFDAIEAKPKVLQFVLSSLLKLNHTARNAFGLNLGKAIFGQVHESFGGELRIAISAGSRFDEDVAADFHSLGFTILQGYGLTETSGAATATFENDNRVGSVGKPMLGTEIKIDHPNDEGVGEVLIRGGVVFKGYYMNPDATADSFTEDGWFRSGDLGKLDKDGHLYIVGRAKDVIVLPSGKNVHPEDLEVHYLKTPLIEELAVIGVRDANETRAGAEKLAAVIIPDFEYLKASNIANSKEAIRYAMDDLGRELPEYQRVRDYIIRTEPLPRTATRKIKRFELKNAVESGTLTPELKETKAFVLSEEDKQLMDSGIGRAVAGVIRNHNKDAEVIHPDMNLEIDLGLDSLARAETFAALEHAFSATFNAEDAASAITVRSTIALIEKNVGSSDLSEPVSADLNWSKIFEQPNDDLKEVRDVLKNRPLFTVFAFSVYKIFNLIFRIFLRLEVTGAEEFRKMKRPFIICPNHQSFLDPFVVCSTYPYEYFKHTFHVGASEFFEGRLMAFVARMLNVVPVDPDLQLMKAMRSGAAGLKNGKILNIYPEGERAYDGELHNFKKGAAILAVELGVPIVPVAIDGLHKVWARRSMKIRPGKVKIEFGEAFMAADVLERNLTSGSLVSASDDDNSAIMPSSDEKYEKVTAYLRSRISEMIGRMRK